MSAEARPLSETVIWPLQRSYFERHGTAAWSPGGVPHEATDNPFIAARYAAVVFGFLRDWLRGGLDPREPLYVLELGAGAGRFAYRFVPALRTLTERAPVELPRVVYVMTDFAEQTLAGWEAHPGLSELVRDGLVDFARLDLPDDGEPRLVHSGVKLAPGRIANPLVVLANYVFDGLPADAFYVHDGELAECLAVVELLDGPGDPLRRLDISYTARPASAVHYGDPDFDELLDHYRGLLRDTVVTVPRAALQCLRELRRIAGDRLLLLAADNAHSRLESLDGAAEPVLILHGSVSLQVNYHALAWYARRHGGDALDGGDDQAALNVLALLFGAPPGGFAETRVAYSDSIGSFGPDDFITIKQALGRVAVALTIGELIAILRLGRWDADTLLACLPTLLARAETADARDREALRDGIDQVWRHHLALPGESDLAFALGMVLHELGYPADALTYFERSARERGLLASTAHNIASCHLQLDRNQLAVDYLEREPQLDPSLSAARRTLSEVAQ